tara:strand:- start:21 stop:329 length:309 start_codon:yes stop_codon:yes gene_type:complete
MTLDHEAIYKSHSTVVSIDDSAGAFDKDGKAVNLDQSKIDSARATLNSEASAIAYKSVRQPLYPSLGEFADAMYWNSKGDSTKLEAYYAACEKVKTDNPKPS